MTFTFSSIPNQSTKAETRGHELLLWLARGIILATLAAAPWFYGGVTLAVQRWLWAGVLGGLTLWIVGGLFRFRELTSAGMVLPVLVLPLFGALLLGTIQLIPLGSGDRLQHHLEEIEPNSMASLGGATVSLYPAATRLDLALLVMALLVFIAGVVLFDTYQSQLYFWGTLTLVGALVAFWGLAQMLKGFAQGQALYTLHGGSSFGTFINKNNAAAFLLLGLSGPIGLLLIRNDSTPNFSRSREGSGGHEDPPRKSILTKLRRILAGLNARQLAALAAAALMTAGIFASHSRGGVIAFVVAGLITGTAFVRAKRTLAVFGGTCVALLLSVFLLSSFNLTAGVQERLGTLSDKRVFENERLAHWNDAVRSTVDFGILGTGLGTYRYAYLPYQVRFQEAWFMHAENQYVEALVVGGSVGLGLLLTALVLMFRAATYLMTPAIAAGTAGLFAVSGQATHALFDFGLFIPANCIAFSLLCGVVAGTAARAAIREPLRKRLICLPRLSGRLSLLVLMALLTNGWIAWSEVSRGAIAETARSSVSRLNSSKDMTRSETQQAIRRVEEAVARCPDNAELRVALANLWVYRYRQSVENRLDTYLAYAQPERKDGDVWARTHLLVLYQQLCAMKRAGNNEAVVAVQEDSDVASNLASARQHYLAAKAACPLFPRIDLKLAMLTTILGDDQENESLPTVAYLDRAVKLTPADPDVLFTAALVAQAAGFPDRAIDYRRRSLSLTPRYAEAAFDLLHDRQEINAPANAAEWLH